MCDRTCPNCGSNDHIGGYGLRGTYVGCTGCGTILANRPDIDAAPLDHPDPEQWVRERTFVLPGAEAVDPEDDAIYTEPLWAESEGW